jgi:hypothetical protein
MTTENTLISTDCLQAFLIDDDNLHALAIKRRL